MARPHHRKKHREQLKQFRHKDETHTAGPRTKAAWIMAVVGAVFGIGISYIATQGDWIWIAVSLAVFAVAGYLVGRRIDREK